MVKIQQFLGGRTARYYVAFLAAIAALIVTSVSNFARASGTLSLPTGIDAATATSGIALFATIGAACIVAVLGVKILPLFVRYLFKWIKMAVR